MGVSVLCPPPPAGDIYTSRASVYLVEVEIVFWLLEVELLTLLCAGAKQQIVKHMVVPAGAKTRGLIKGIPDL